MTATLSACLWYDDQAEKAAHFYVSIFKDGKIKHTTFYTKEGFEIHGKPAGTVLTVEFEILGRHFLALNGGPIYKFSEAVSIIVNCDSQEEIDYYWQSLIANGGEAGPCGWLKDQFGLSWQVTPKILETFLKDPDVTKVQRVTQAFMQMQKFDIKKLQQAYDGK